MQGPTFTAFLLCTKFVSKLNFQNLYDCSICNKKQQISFSFKMSFAIQALRLVFVLTLLNLFAINYQLFLNTKTHSERSEIETAVERNITRTIYGDKIIECIEEFERSKNKWLANDN